MANELGAPAGEPVARLRAVTKSYGSDVVLRDLDLEINPHEIVGLLGRSGSGKSTILRILAGLEDSDSGECAVGARSSVAFQESRLFPWKSVIDNVVLGLPASGRAEREERAADILDEVGLAAKSAAWPLSLSGGQAQRVSLARALVSEPGLLLLDEPFSALDALTRIEMQQLLLRIWQRRRCSALLVTHDVDEALTLADRVIVLAEGRIAADVRVDSPRSRPGHHHDLVPLRELLLERLGVQSRPQSELVGS